MKKIVFGFLIVLFMFGCSNKVTTNIDINTSSLDGNVVLQNASPDTVKIFIKAVLNDIKSVTYQDTADENGYFYIQNMQPGNYNVTISFDTFAFLSKTLSAKLFINKKTSLQTISFNKVEPNCFIQGYVACQNQEVQNTQIDIYYKTDDNEYIHTEQISPDTTGFYFADNLYPREIKLIYSLNGFDSITKFVSLVQNEITQIDTVVFENIAVIPNKSIDIDGVIDAGWQPIYQNEHSSNWSASNDFADFYIAYDNDSLYIAVTGGFDTSGNCVNIYIDKDYGEGTGINDFSQISGSSIGDHLRKNVIVDDNFGADLAFSEWALASDINVVSLTEPSQVDANILFSNSLVNSTTIEFAIPLDEIYENGTVPAGKKIAVVGLIGGGGDQYFADDTIPQQENAAHFSEVLKIKFPE